MVIVSKSDKWYHKFYTFFSSKMKLPRTSLLLECYDMYTNCSLSRLHGFRNQTKLAKTVSTLDTSINQFKFNKTDLQGAKIFSIGLPYGGHDFKYVICNGSESQFEGHFFDTMEILGQEYNFSLVTHLAETFGSVPTSGFWNDTNATFEGSFRSIMENEYDCSTESWNVILGRWLWIDFSDFEALNHGSIVAKLYSKSLSVSQGPIFLKPFTTVSWICISIIFGMLLLIIVSLKIYPNLENSYKWIAFCSWLVFVLIQGFYDGALTMFFSNQPSLPFSTVREALALYPDWKMLLPKESMILVQPYVEAGDKYFTNYHNVLYKDKELLQENVEEVLKVMERQPRRFVMGFESLFDTAKADLVS